MWLRVVAALDFDGCSCREVTNRVWLRGSLHLDRCDRGCREVTNRVWLREHRVNYLSVSVSRRSQTGCGCEFKDGE